MTMHSPQPTHSNTVKKIDKETASSAALFIEVPLSSFDKAPTIGTRKSLDISAHTLSQELPNGSSVHTTVTAFWSFGDAIMDSDSEDEFGHDSANLNEVGFNWSQAAPVSRAGFDSDIDDDDDNDSCSCSSVSIVSKNVPKEESMLRQLPQSELDFQQEVQAIRRAHQEAVSEEDHDEQPDVAEKEVVGGDKKAKTSKKSKKKPKKLSSKKATSREDREEEQPSTGSTKTLSKKEFNWIQPNLSLMNDASETNETGRTSVGSSSCSLLDKYSLPPKTKSSGLRQTERRSYLKGRRSRDSTARRSLISSALQQLDI